MIRLGFKSRRELVGVHPDLIIVTVTACSMLPRGADLTVYDGLRTPAEQRENIRRGVSKTMASMHLPQADGYSHAVDLVPYIDGQVRWDSKDAKLQERITRVFDDIASAMRKASELHDIQVESGYEMWGWDRPHYQLGKVYRA